MDQSKNNSAKHAFFYMLSLVALIFMAISTGMIAFQIINKNIADVIDIYRRGYSSGALKFGISALVISAPIYYFTMRQIVRELYNGTLAKDSGVRKWLTYLIVFVSSVVMLGWLVGTLYNFLDGELTTKFILKSAVSIFIAASILSFYLYDIKREKVVGEKSRVVKIYLFASLAVVIAAIAGAFAFVETPSETRNRKLDQAVLNKFDMIDGAVTNFYSKNKKLPKSLAELKNDNSYLIKDNIIDPSTKQEFEYKAVSEDKFALCAEFRTDNRESGEAEEFYLSERWPHGKGRECIERAIDKNSLDRFPISK